MIDPDYTVLIVYIVLGLLLIGYYATLKDGSSNYLDNLWSNNGSNIVAKKNLKKLFVASMIISAIAGIYLFVYLTWYHPEKIFGYDYSKEGKYFIHASLIILIGFSLMWIPAFNYSKNVTAVVLFMASLGALLLAISLGFSNKRNIMNTVGIVSAGYMFFHMFVFDFIIWNGFV